MPTLVRIILAAASCLALALAAIYALVASGEPTAERTHLAPPGRAPRTTRPTPDTSGIPRYGEGFMDDSGYTLSTAFTGEVADPSSLDQVVQANRTRVDRGIRTLLGEIADRRLDPPSSLPDAAELCQRQIWIAALHMSRGDFDAAAPWLEKALATASSPGLPAEPRANVEALIGVAAMRRGELANCVACLGPSSCLLPIVEEARHRFPDGSREAMRRFQSYLEQRPDDLGVRWALNIAAMTVGEHPGGVPPDLRIPLDRPLSDLQVGRFVNVAQSAGLAGRGPNMAGGVIFDDFDGDGRPDLFLCSFDADLGSALYRNNGGGAFEDVSDAWDARRHVLANNCTSTDFDNDGRLDVLLLRGGWEAPAPLTLLRNTGERFEDVTAAAGLAEPIACHSACWADYDNDGDLDLFACGEYLADRPGGGLFADPKALRQGDPRNRCRLYRNDGGTFADVAEPAGVTNERYAKGAAWGDYDDDGFIDLYVSNFGGPNRLYHSRGDGTFEDVAETLGVAEPWSSFPCWFWDYDNDGRLDIFVAGYQATVADYVADRLGRPRREGVECSRLYRNLGPEGFHDATLAAGLDRVYLPMGASLGDFDNDGYLDAYLATGRPSYLFLVPNVLLKNVAGSHFEDVSLQSGTAHLQKGHGVGFADYDGDGDLDLFAELGGAVPGDRAHNALFRNPGHDRPWLAVKLAGRRANRPGIGARLAVEIDLPDDSTRTVHRRIGAQPSYGGNSLVEHVGLGDGTRVRRLTITWPGSGTLQQVESPPLGRTLLIEEPDGPPDAGAGSPPAAPEPSPPLDSDPPLR